MVRYCRRVISEAATFAGRPFLFSVLGAAVLIVLPPPGWVPLVAVMAAIAGLLVWRRQRIEPPPRDHAWMQNR